MNLEKINNLEVLDKEKLKLIIGEFCKEKGYSISNPETCKNMCGNWNQQVGLELSHNHNIACSMLWVKKKNDFLPENHPAVEHGYVYHCFIEIEKQDMFIDVTPRQFNTEADEIIFLSKKEIEEQGWQNITKNHGAQKH